MRKIPRLGFPTPADYHFWSTKRAPRWASPFVGDASIGVDECVNAHSGRRQKIFEIEASNLCSLLKMRRARGASIEEFLAEVSVDPGTILTATAKYRVKYGAKWLSRIRERAANERSSATSSVASS